MLQIHRIRCIWTSFLVGVTLVMSLARAQEPKKKPEPPPDQVKALIDRLTQLDRQDIGYSGSATGIAFLPLAQSETQVFLFGQEAHASSEVLKSLVKLGTRAIPKLLEHLSDDRPTKIALSHSGVLGAMFILQDEVEAKKGGLAHFGGETQYTVKVGDLCYVAIGQIVNRNYSAVRYLPTAMIVVTAVSKFKKLREDLINDWGGLTEKSHRDSLARDLLNSNDNNLRNGASLRLAYYYPAALEPLVLKELGRPTYSVLAVQELVRDRLYPARTAKDRKALVDEFVAKNGELARDGIRWALFQDLDTQEADEQGRLSPKLKPRYQARVCLMDVFSLPTTVKSKDRPLTGPLSDSTQAQFVQTLRYDRSEKLDQALRDILARTDDDYLAQGCLERLVGRGYDADIEAYLKRHLPHLKDGDRKELLAFEPKLGWTRLHAAVELDVLELVENALREKIPVDARGRDGRTALHVAAKEGKAAITEALLNAKANPNIKDEKGRLAVELAVDEDHPKIVRLLVANQSDVADVFVGATVGATERLMGLLKEKPSLVKLRNRQGLNPLHVAAREGNAEAVRALIDAGADVKAIDERPKDDDWPQYTNGWTPLHFAAMADKTSTAAILLDHGADANAADKRGKHTPLHLAAWEGNADLVTLLLARKADREAKDEMNRTPLALAKEKGHTAVIKLLER